MIENPEKKSSSSPSYQHGILCAKIWGTLPFYGTPNKILLYIKPSSAPLKMLFWAQKNDMQTKLKKIWVFSLKLAFF